MWFAKASGSGLFLYGTVLKSCTSRERTMASETAGSPLGMIGAGSPRCSMSRTDLAELRRLWEAAKKGQWLADDREVYSDCSGGNIVANRPDAVNWESGEKWTANAAFISAAHNALPSLLDELEAARKELRRLTQANGDIRKERDRAVKEAQRQDGVAKGLRSELEVVREANSATVEMIAALSGRLKAAGQELEAAQEQLQLERHSRLIGIADELETWAEFFGGIKAIQPAPKFWQGKEEGFATAAKKLRERAAKLRQEVGE